MKKEGVLGKEVMIRKTMLDECKGERLEEMMAAFSTAVVRKRIAESKSSRKSIAGRLAIKKTLTAAERESMLPLAIAHKGALTTLLQRKEAEKAAWRMFDNAMEEQEQILREREGIVRESGASKSPAKSRKGAPGMKQMIQEHWQGDPRWLDIIIQGEETHDAGILNQSFHRAKRIVQYGSEGDPQEPPKPGLLEELEARVTAQQARLQKWKAYHAQFISPAKTPKVPNSWGSPWKTPGRSNYLTPGAFRGTGDVTSTPLMTKKYQDLFQSSQTEEDNGGEVRETANGIHDHSRQQQGAATPNADRDGSSRRGSNDDEADAMLASTRRVLDGPVSVGPQAVEQVDHGSDIVSSPCPRPHTAPTKEEVFGFPPSPRSDATSDLENWSDPEPTPQHYREVDLSNLSEPEDIGSGNVKPPTSAVLIQPKLSLLQRTRQSINLSSINRGSDVFPPDSSPTPIGRSPCPQDAVPSNNTSENALGRRASLLDRTRQSISSIPHRPHQRSRSSILPSEKPTFPVNQFETSRRMSPTKLASLVEENSIDLYHPDVDYHSVFMSRPKVQMSPVGTPPETPVREGNE